MAGVLRILAGRAAGFHRASLVDRNRAATKVLAVALSDGLVSSGVIRHFDKAEAAGAAGFTVHRNIDRENLTKLGEMRADFLFRSTERDTADEQLRGHAYWDILFQDIDN